MPLLPHVQLFLTRRDVEVIAEAITSQVREAERTDDQKHVFELLQAKVHLLRLWKHLQAETAQPTRAHEEVTQ